MRMRIGQLVDFLRLEYGFTYGAFDMLFALRLRCCGLIDYPVAFNVLCTLKLFFAISALLPMVYLVGFPVGKRMLAL